ncbi:hypothetical protein DX130_11705 [Paenibacillus paeoniae]|uniref:Uncharacterized protein n=1 Tax=Paenibacillus paeoniae TaxID=2292705 RepID=A0A371PNW4_9BACL|nr:hypothetical protein DX130_11705 [Paenibacillus paeoniae]
MQSVEKKAAGIVRRDHWLTGLVWLLLSLIGLLFSSSSLQTVLVIAAGAAVAALLWTLQKRLTPALRRMQLQKMFQQYRYELASGLAIDHQAAIRVFQEGDKPRTYEMLREIGSLVHNDQLKLEQIMLLQTFQLRKDMDLMIEPLLMDSFNTDLVSYIGEIAKIRRDLIKENTFRYVLLHEMRILSMPSGEAILAAVAGAAVRKDRYMTMYPYLLTRYARFLPKDRFLRLFKYAKSARSGPLYDEVMRIYEEKYKWEPDFQNT